MSATAPEPGFSPIGPFEADVVEEELVRALRFREDPQRIERRRLRRAAIARRRDEIERAALARRWAAMEASGAP